MVEKYLAQFKIKPSPTSTLFFTVTVFPTIKSMREYANKRDRMKHPRFHGLMTSWHKIRFKKKRQITHPEMGEILFCKKYLGVSVVSHECLHAAIAFTKRKNVSLAMLSDNGNASEEEEVLCYVLGNLSAQVYAFLYKHSIIPTPA